MAEATRGIPGLAAAEGNVPGTGRSEGSLPHRRFPCVSCPWRTDTIGRFGFSNLADYASGTCGSPGREQPIGAEMFACHTSRTDPPELCAGWLASVGYDHLTVRLAVLWGDLPAAALPPGDGWPELFGSYAEMAETQGAPDA
jgi:Family of unknown function (DUF6283)